MKIYLGSPESSSVKLGYYDVYNNLHNYKTYKQFDIKSIDNIFMSGTYTVDFSSGFYKESNFNIDIDNIFPEIYDIFIDNEVYRYIYPIEESLSSNSEVTFLDDYNPSNYIIMYKNLPFSSNSIVFYDTLEFTDNVEVIETGYTHNNTLMHSFAHKYYTYLSSHEYNIKYTAPESIADLAFTVLLKESSSGNIILSDGSNDITLNVSGKQITYYDGSNTNIISIPSGLAVIHFQNAMMYINGNNFSISLNDPDHFIIHGDNMTLIESYGLDTSFNGELSCLKVQPLTHNHGNNAYMAYVLAKEPHDNLIYIKYRKNSSSVYTIEPVSLRPLYYRNDIYSNQDKIKYPILYSTASIPGDGNLILFGVTTNDSPLSIDRNGHLYIKKFNFTFYTYNNVILSYNTLSIDNNPNYIVLDPKTNTPFKFNINKYIKADVVADDIISLPFGDIVVLNHNHSSSLGGIDIFINGDLFDNNNIKYVDSINGYIVLDNVKLSRYDQIFVTYYTYNNVYQVCNFNLFEAALNYDSILIGLKPSASLYEYIYPDDPYPDYKFFWTTQELYNQNKGYLFNIDIVEPAYLPSDSIILYSIDFLGSLNINDLRIRGEIENKKDLDPFMVKMWDFGHYDGSSIPKDGILFIQLDSSDRAELENEYNDTFDNIKEYIKEFYYEYIPVYTKIIFIDENGNEV